MQADEIERYLTELGQELANQGLQKPVRGLIIGGAYMLLLVNAARTTDDIDIFWLEKETLQRALYALQEGVQAVAAKNGIEPNWFNFLTQLLMYDQVYIPKGKLWKRYGLLYIYTPPKEYILALKILAGRDKDLADCKILLPQTKIKTRHQAQQLLDRYVLPTAQRDNAEQIENSLSILFGEHKGD